MCQFFSFCSVGDGKFYYFDNAMRKAQLDGRSKRRMVRGCRMSTYLPDSHSSTCAYFDLDEDTTNKYEYDPFTKQFRIDQLNSDNNDSRIAKDWVSNLDFKTIFEDLTLKIIIKPFVGQKSIPTEYDLKQFGKAIKAIEAPGNFCSKLDHEIRKGVGGSIVDTLREGIIDLFPYEPDNDFDYDYVVTALTASQFNLSYSVDIAPFYKLWNRGLVFRNTDVWQYLHRTHAEWQLGSGYRRQVVHRRIIAKG